MPENEGLVLVFYLCEVGWFPSNGGNFSLFLSCDKTVKVN